MTGSIWNLYVARPLHVSNLYAQADNPASKWEAGMLDAIFIGIGLAFFALAIGYTLICERL